MEKLATAKHEIHELIRRRWSPRAFSGKIEKKTLLTLLEAARWAPSSFNEQPWGFLVATKDEPAEFEKMLGCLVEFNRSWAKTAPVLMISLAKLKFDQSGKPNRHSFHDVGQAAAYMTIQAMALGIFVHQMAGFDADKVRKEYAVPDSWEPVAAIALGYPGDAAALEDEKARKGESAPRARKELDTFVFGAKFGERATVLE